MIDFNILAGVTKTPDFQAKVVGNEGALNAFLYTKSYIHMSHVGTTHVRAPVGYAVTDRTVLGVKKNLFDRTV